MKISVYRGADKQGIEALFTRTFSNSAGREEGAQVGVLVHRLMAGTDSNDLKGFTAIEHGRLAGCIFFTTLQFDCPVSAFLLSPVAVDTPHQGKGVGQKLINFGISHLSELGVELLFTYGDPNYYSKMGFKHLPDQVAQAPFELSQPEGWLGRSLSGFRFDSLPGRARCVEAFNHSEYW